MTFLQSLSLGDVIFLALLVISFLWGLVNGIWHQMKGLLFWVCGLGSVFLFSKQVSQFLYSLFPQLAGQSWGSIAALVVTFLIGALLSRLLLAILDQSTHLLHISLLSRVLGAFIAAAKVCIVMALLCYFFESTSWFQSLWPAQSYGVVWGHKVIDLFFSLKA